MSDFVVFYRRLTNAQDAELNAGGWSSPIGQAYLGCESRMDREPEYSGAIEFDLFEKAAFVTDCPDKHSVYLAMQNGNDFCAWRDDPDIRCYTTFPRSMSVADVIYEPATYEWTKVDAVGFKPITDENFIEYLRKKI